MQNDLKVAVDSSEGTEGSGAIRPYRASANKNGEFFYVFQFL